MANVQDKAVYQARWNAKVDRSGGPAACWPWTGFRNAHGYGKTSARWAGAGLQYAHRVAWTQAYGPIPAGRLVCHHCDNPPCCNPAHLFVGTDADNMADMKRKGFRRTLTPQQVGDVVRLRKDGWSFRTLGAFYGVSYNCIRRVCIDPRL